jgi:hypothetical protein
VGANHAHLVHLSFIDLTEELAQGLPCISYALFVSRLDRVGIFIHGFYWQRLLCQDGATTLCHNPFAQPRNSTARKERAVFRRTKVTVRRKEKGVSIEHQIGFYEP